MNNFQYLHTLIDCLKSQHEKLNHAEVSEIIKEAIEVLNSINSDEVKNVKKLAQLFYLLNGISKEEFYRDNDRKREIVNPRQAFIFLAHKIYGYTSTAAGIELNRNHATVLCSCRKVEEQFAHYKKWLVFWKKEIKLKTGLIF